MKRPLRVKISKSLLRDAVFGIGVYYATGTVFILGTVFGWEFLQRPAEFRGGEGLSPILAQHAGQAYVDVADHGYEAARESASALARFPAYPLLGYVMTRLTGMASEQSLVVVSHLCLLGAMFVLARYLALRWPDGPREVVTFSLIALGLFPTGVFFRCAYTESLFLLVSVLTMYGMTARWPLALCAVVAGLATAIRPVGVALLFPLALHVWQTSAPGQHRWLRLTATLPLGCWGLFAYMGYQYVAFGDALAFAKAHENWRVQPPSTWDSKLIALLTLQPVWAVFDPQSPGYWAREGVPASAFFSLHLANPLYFAMAIGLTWLGKWKNWLNWPETLLVAGLLFLPYATRAYEMSFGSMGRFMSVAFPIYLVLGQVLSRISAAAASLAIMAMALLLFAYSALYAAGYLIN